MDSRLPPHGEPVRALTPRQEQIVDLLALGLSYRNIGEELGISWRTVGDRVAEISLLIPNEGKLEPDIHVRAWAGWRYWRRRFDKHPRLAPPGPPLTTGSRAD